MYDAEISKRTKLIYDALNYTDYSKFAIIALHRNLCNFASDSFGMNTEAFIERYGEEEFINSITRRTGKTLYSMITSLSAILTHQVHNVVIATYDPIVGVGFGYIENQYHQFLAKVFESELISILPNFYPRGFKGKEFVFQVGSAVKVVEFYPPVGLVSGHHHVIIEDKFCLDKSVFLDSMAYLSGEQVSDIIPYLPMILKYI